MMRVHICSFSAIEELRGKALTYDNVKRLVLKAGRFSVFEATRNDKCARIFTDLHHDSELIVTPIAFPWISVKQRGTTALEHDTRAPK